MPVRKSGMERGDYLDRMVDGQRRAIEFSIKLRLEADEGDDVVALAEAADILEIAVEKLETARKVLVSA